MLACPRVFHRCGYFSFYSFFACYCLYHEVHFLCIDHECCHNTSNLWSMPMWILSLACILTESQVSSFDQFVINLSFLLSTPSGDLYEVCCFPGAFQYIVLSAVKFSRTSHCLIQFFFLSLSVCVPTRARSTPQLGPSSALKSPPTI